MPESKRLRLIDVLQSKTHWNDPNLVNPVTQTFVDYCIRSFPAGRTMDGVGDTYAHFHGWVNAQTYPMIPLSSSVVIYASV